MPQAPDSETRLTRLEEKLAHQEQGMAELNDSLYRQQQEIDALRAHQRELVERLRSLREAGPGAGEETPPHY